MAHLTKRFIESIPSPQSGYVILWDDALKWFGAGVTASGVRTCVVNFSTHAGRQRRMSIGRSTSSSPTVPAGRRSGSSAWSQSAAIPFGERRRERVLSEEEIAVLWERLPQAGINETVCRIFQMMLITAQRPGEVASIEWRDLDLVTGWWTIPAEKSKTGLTHSVPLPEMALDLIGRCSPEHCHLVTGGCTPAKSHCVPEGSRRKTPTSSLPR